MTTTTERPSTRTTTGSSLEIGAPTTRAERRAAEKAAQRTGSKNAKQQAKAARKEARKAPNPYKTGDHVRYDTVYDGHRVSYTGGKVTKAPGREVVVEFASGIDFRLDHRDPGLTKTRLI